MDLLRRGSGEESGYQGCQARGNGPEGLDAKGIPPSPQAMDSGPLNIRRRPPKRRVMGNLNARRRVLCNFGVRRDK